jgi:NifU-like protein involved in Fe-S cluster formation
MNSRGGAALYTPDILALAVELADYPLDNLPRRGEAHSRVCGSRVIVGTDSLAAGRIGRVGAQVTACAIGQAAAALFLRSAAGRDGADIASALAAIEAWLAGGDQMPSWPDVAELEPARAYPARHAAILLPWKAALAALSNPAGAG